MNIEVHISTNSKESEVNILDSCIYEISVKSSPRKNAANLELIDLLSKYFNVSKSSIRIKRGIKSKIKYISIEEDES